MLYIVATPIGNMEDMSLRAIQTLKNVSLIAAEDTRRSSILLNRFEIKTPMVSYQKFNEKTAAAQIIERLKQGGDVALISDAGTPLVSDPGAALIGECIKENLPFTVVGVTCAAVAALLLSGLPSDNFCMLGFLPDKLKERKRLIEPYLFVPATLIFYCPPQSVIKDLEFLASCLGQRNFALVKEISKVYEGVFCGVLGKTDGFDINLKGEFVLVVEGYKGMAEEKSAAELVKEYISLGLDKMDAIKRAARDKSLSKSEVYRQVSEKKD